MFPMPVAAPPPAQIVAAPVAATPAAPQAAPGQAAPSGPPSATTDPVQSRPTQPPASAPPARPQRQAPREVHLAGDWGGVLPALSDIGLRPDVRYINQTVFAPRGAANREARSAGQLMVGMTANLKKLTGAVPGTFQATLVRRHGEQFNATSGLNLLINPQSIAGRGEIWRVSQFWYRTSLAGVDVKLGRMQLNEDFNQARCDFISGYFCIGENVRVAPNSWPTTPVSQWGVRLQHKVADGVTVRTGAYQVNPRNLDVNKPLFVGFAGATGVLVPAEVSWQTKIDGLPGTYTAGVLFSSGDANDPVLNRAGQIRSVFGGQPLVRNAQWGGWINARQQLIAADGDGAGGLAVFFNLSLFTERTASNVSAMGLGVNYSGLLPGRPRDEIGIGIGRARLNNRVTEAARYINANGLGNVPVRTAEKGVEVYYAINVADGLTISPDAQFIFDPAGDHDRRNAIVLGVRTSIVL